MKTLVYVLGLMIGMPVVFAQEASTPPAAPAPEAEAPIKDPQLEAARKKLVVLRAQKGEKHPDVQKQMRYIAELQKRPRSSQDSNMNVPAGTPLEVAKQELASLRARYTDEHPLVKNQAKRVAQLEQQP